MKPRNLRSNDHEQIIFEKYFSDCLGWFYERKEGAWNAFKSDHRRWSTINKRPVDFSSGNRKIRKVDNEDIAQTWLAFIGFSQQAVDQKRYLFQDDRKLYDLIFLNRTRKHGAYYAGKISDGLILEESLAQSPSGEGLLLSYIVRQFAQEVIRSKSENREAAIERLGINKLDKNEQEIRLSDDREYMKGIILRDMSFLFVDFFGYIMFSTFQDNLHDSTKYIVRNGSISKILIENDMGAVKSRVYSGQHERDDVIIAIWHLYNHCISQMLAQTWFRQWQEAPNRSKFYYSDSTRRLLFSEYEEANKMFQAKEGLSRSWAIGFNEVGGVESYVRASTMNGKTAVAA